MRVVAIKLWELQFDVVDGATVCLEFLGAVHHGANIGCTLSGGEIEGAVLGVAEGFVDCGAAIRWTGMRWTSVAGCGHLYLARIMF